MRSVTFPNGLTLTSTALSVTDIQSLFQIAILQCLGINPGTITTGTLTQGSAQIVVASLGLAAVGNPIIGNGIPPGTVIQAIGTSGGFGGGGFGNLPFNNPAVYGITMSQNASLSGDVQVAIASDVNAFNAVRVGWQTFGQPGWNVQDDIISLVGVVVDDPYNRIRDFSNLANDDTTVNQVTSYTRCWEMRFSAYGPNSADNARLIKSCLRLNWFRDIVSPSNIYLVPNESDPVRAPENFNKQWWDRSDYRVRYYEAVQETITQQTIATAEVILEHAIGGYGNTGYGDNPYGDPTTVTVDITA